jgi:hypothetical protein
VLHVEALGFIFQIGQALGQVSVLGGQCPHTDKRCA